MKQAQLDMRIMNSIWWVRIIFFYKMLWSFFQTPHLLQIALNCCSFVPFGSLFHSALSFYDPLAASETNCLLSTAPFLIAIKSLCYFDLSLLILLFFVYGYYSSLITSFAIDSSVLWLLLDWCAIGLSFVDSIVDGYKIGCVKMRVHFFKIFMLLIPNFGFKWFKIIINILQLFF